MPRIGEFKETDYGFKGHIHMREGRFNIELHHTGNKEKDGPHYQAKAPNGAEIGAAWNKIGASSHEPYLRLSIDDMAMPSKIHGNLVNEGNGQWGLIWNRSNGNTQTATQEKQAAPEIER